MNKLLDKLVKNTFYSFLFVSMILLGLFILDFHFWDSNIVLIVIFGFLETINIVRLKYSRKILWIINRAIDYRYALSLGIFLFCLLFHLHGSSIGFYNEIILEQTNEKQVSKILGDARLIRSDEWIVQTPYFFSQDYNNYALESHQMSLSGQNMTIAYNAPVLNLTSIVKPQTWGYLLFGNEIGLSWYWCFQLILLCLLSFELIMILTKNNRLISSLGLLLIGFSPLFHWWFIPHIPIIFMWAMALTVLGYYFSTTINEKKRILIALAFAISLCAFTLAIFPSCQIPAFLISLVLLVTLLIRDQEYITFKKKHGIHLAFVVIFVIVILTYFIFTSLDAIRLILNTVYPGARVSTGNNAVLADLFSDLTILFTPYKDITYLNNSEVSDFIHLGPLFLFLFPFISKKIDKKDALIGRAVFVMLLVQIIFMGFGFTETFAKISLFSNINRMSISYGYLATIFTLWGIYIFTQYENLLKEKAILLISLSYGLIYLTLISKLWLSYLPIYVYVLEIILYVFLVYLVLNGRKKLSLLIFASMIMMASFTINPLVTGTSSITNHPLYNEVSQIIKKDNSNWVALNDSTMASYLLASGAKVINCVNYYPDYDKWESIDPTLTHKDVYNRYTHINLYLTDVDEIYQTLTPDSIAVNINTDTLKAWDIKYVFSTLDVKDYLTDLSYECIYCDVKNQHYIYHLDY